MSEARPPVPEGMKRTVRQRCKFGCVICGAPIYHYDHFQEYSEVKEHSAENIILLCPNHHQDKTSGRLPKDVLKRFTENPYNYDRDKTSTYSRLFITGNETELLVGGNSYKSTITNGGRFDAIRIYEHTVVGYEREEDNILLNILMTDKLGQLLLKVDRGELTVATGIWDYTFEGSEIIIRAGMGNIELKMCITEFGMKIERGAFFAPPIGLIIEPDHHSILCIADIIWKPSLKMTGCSFDGCGTGLYVE